LHDEIVVGSSLPVLVGCFVCCSSIFAMIINSIDGSRRER